MSRSTKAGAETPATRQFLGCGCSSPDPLNEGRSRDPGDTASVKAALSARHGRRSTKAGAETPATRADISGLHVPLRARNAGLSRDHGDTAS